MLPWLAAPLLAFLLAACGQKRGLYLPENHDSQAVPTVEQKVGFDQAHSTEPEREREETEGPAVGANE